MRKHKAIRVGRISFLINISATIIMSTLLVLLLGLFLLSAGMGELFIGPLNIIQIIFGQGSEFEQLIVTSFRLPRIIIAILAGICLAVAGAILQGLVRNPLASPDLIGLTGGASVAVVLFLTLFSDENHSLTVSIHWLPLSAFIGASVVALLLYVLAWKGGVSPITLILVGIGLTALTKSLTTLFMIMGPIYQASQANIWITGSVYGSNWKNVYTLLPVTCLLVVISFIMVRHVNIQELGEDMAKNVGHHVQKSRLSLLLISTALTGSAVAFAGGISFVGLLAPHIARRLVGSSFGSLLPVSALIGAILVLVADLIGRTMFLPIEVPAGVFTAAIGAPYFIYLLYKQRNAS
ncbi:FecCD family ABC transporter permease [Metabacillus iocasae]|uniref:Iron complex transport system permease protein n=1 Tax=Priestia iocasae TaxID=2291674 RepID=A0ABS2QYI6_9BACI|nr:iron ABC transporter permease [Metabacillus iocasae]MBM7704560.1 iron complex transport system permease protein [Metabacillus iocasae]